MAGVTLARHLDPRFRVTVLEKSRGLGGRMAVRHREGFSFDHGAQYFTARDERFRRLVADATRAGAVAVWPAEIARLPRGAEAVSQAGEPRYIASPGMSGLAAHLAAGIVIRREAEVHSITRTPAGWALTGPDAAPLGHFDLVVSTAPAPQTARLMPACFSGAAAVAAARLSGCFTLMLGLEGPSPFSFHLARLDHPILQVLSVNSSKPGRGSAVSLVVHSRNDWADAHLEMDRETVTAEMRTALTALTALPLHNIIWSDLHRWRYANVEQAAGVPHLFDGENGLAACGDWCLANRVEAAFLSACSLADRINGML